jgi:hypothetical protein
MVWEVLGIVILAGGWLCLYGGRIVKRLKALNQKLDELERDK